MRIYKKWLRLCFRGILSLFFATIFIKLFIWWVEINDRDVFYISRDVMKMNVEDMLEDFVNKEKNIGCELPLLDPFSAEASRYDINLKAAVCDAVDWVECNYSQCYVRDQILNHMTNLACLYRSIIYVDDDHHYLGEADEVIGGAKYLLNVSDYVEVICYGTDVTNVSRQPSQWHGYKAGFRPLESTATNTTSLNVLMLLLDSTSRNTFIRRLPISYKVLTKELKAVVMKGFNIVAETTAGTMWPILSGHNVLELPNWEKWPNNKTPVDQKLFLFSLLKDHGYRTAFFEDMPWYGTFNYRYNGFTSMPVDHYMRNLFLGIGWDRQFSDQERYCFGSESLFKFMVDYTAKLFKMDVQKFCVTLTGTFTHDDINLITTLDEDLAHFLRKFKQEGHLENTLLFVMGDHGSRVSDLRNTYHGRIEEFQPFLSIILPESLKRARPSALHNLVYNSKILTTPYDIHTTILDALGLKKHRNNYQVLGANRERGLSLFEPLSETRSCGEAGIVPNFCACARWKTLFGSDISYAKTAEALARFINDFTAQIRDKCSERDLLSIAEVYRLSPMIDMMVDVTTTNTSGDPVVKNGRKLQKERLRPQLEYYQVKIIMSPGESIFEGSVQYNVKKDSYDINDKYISRIDRYKVESWCVSQTHPHLSKFCHCSEPMPY